MKLKVKRLRSGARLPTRAYEASLGYDLYFCPANGKPLEIPRGVPLRVETGIAIEPPRGFGFFIKERSSIGSQGLAVRSGVFDEDYRGEVMFPMIYLGQADCFVLQPGQRIAQMVLIPTPMADVVAVDELSNTERGDKGFGSTGE